MEGNLIMDINRISKKLLINDIFYGLFLSTIEKKENKEVPVAAVGLNKSTMEFTLHINPEEWFKFSDEVKFGILKHESLHLTMFHLLVNDRWPNHTQANIALDIEVNQKIKKEYLPSWGCFLEEFQDKYPQLDWKANAGGDHYYKELGKLSDKEKEELGIDEKAQHQWIITDGEGNASGPLTDAQKDAVRVQIESTIESIAEEVAKSQGHVPHEISEMIKGFVKPKPKFNYTKYIRNYVGNSTRYMIGRTKLKDNQRFPGTAKVVLKPISRTLVLVDESGSVSQTELLDFLNEIHHLSKKVDIEIRPFDTAVMAPVKYNGKGEFKRTNCGGTSFTAAVDYYNSDKTYHSCLIFTDGHAEVPPACNKRLLWVISSNGTIESIKDHAQFIKIPSND